MQKKRKTAKTRRDASWETSTICSLFHSMEETKQQILAYPNSWRSQPAFPLPETPPPRASFLWDAGLYHYRILGTSFNINDDDGKVWPSSADLLSWTIRIMGLFLHKRPTCLFRCRPSDILSPVFLKSFLLSHTTTRANATFNEPPFPFWGTNVIR